MDQYGIKYFCSNCGLYINYRITEHLSSGQYGTVDKGFWNHNQQLTEVAVKGLKGVASEEEEIKFLQEAAINGQFHHPNVVRLFGVVTVGRPVSVILTYEINSTHIIIIMLLLLYNRHL